jgi:DNA-binding Lrp family transcriptional regulator
LQFRKVEDIFHFVERTGSPALLPIFRSRQQAELLADILDQPEREQSLTELGERLGIPGPSVHREIERAERAGIVRSRRVGRTRLVGADVTGPHFDALRQVLVGTFGVPARLRAALADVPGVEAAYIFGSWAARWHGEPGSRPVGDVDLLVLGGPDRDQLYAAAHAVSVVIGREVQVQVREAGWIETGTGSFHDTVVNRPFVEVLPGDAAQARNDDASATARAAS